MYSHPCPRDLHLRKRLRKTDDVLAKTELNLRTERCIHVLLHTQMTEKMPAFLSSTLATRIAFETDSTDAREIRHSI